MDDFFLDIVIGTGPSARSARIDLPPFTLVGATTRAGLLSAPLRDRFGVLSRLEFYESADLCSIVERTAEVFDTSIRSEEHTSELQSRGHLVCRLLLEKKNINT